MRRLICICALLIGACHFSYGSVDAKREAVLQIATSQIGVREATGRNDGKQVEQYLASVKLGRGYPWCAAFVSWCYDKVSIKHPVSGYCPHWFKTGIVYLRTKDKSIFESNAKPGDIFGIWFNNLQRVAHVGIVYKVTPDYVVTIEGNTNDALSREGDGVYKKKRLARQIYIVANYFSEK